MTEYGRSTILKEALRGEAQTDAMTRSPAGGAEFPADSHNAAVNKTETGPELPLAFQEREEWLEQWMKNVKTFIRNIDVKAL